MGRGLVIPLPPPPVHRHDGLLVVRDDLIEGGTKARYLGALFLTADEVCYASPAEGGAQTALAYVAREMGKRATIFVPRRLEPHARAIMAKRLGATVRQIKPGYLSVLQSRARDYCARTGARLAPFGMDVPEASAAIAAAALATGLEPDEVWCAAGSGVLARGLARAWPDARLRVVQVGRALTPAEVAGARIFRSPIAFAKRQPRERMPPFPSDPHYDAKAWDIAVKEHGSGRVVFWNVTGPAQP